ncbi:MarR family winged helix-turn-helix transcriptional regulator [Salinactinospora qingdaonensis]|uniref:MarR family transcriptional regulator n=1 Tax=Salinactinospora qingdaonensis TaxID=702744 RepID=A0ABP7FC37_9ACTN
MASAFEDTPARLRALPSRLLTQVATHAQRLVTQGLAGADARRYHYALLATLEEFGPASQAVLGRRCGMDRSDVVATVNELAQREMVRRTPDPEDRRRNVVTITEAGIQALHQLDELLESLQDELLAPLSTEERDQLVLLLARLLEHHSRAP